MCEDRFDRPVEMRIGEDGTRRRWELWTGARFLAKGPWCATEAEARLGYDEFEDAMRDADIKGEGDA